VGEKSLTEKAIIEALQARDARMGRSSLQRSYQQPKISEHSPSLTPTTQIGFTKMSDMYGESRHSPKNEDESSSIHSHQKYSIPRTSHS